MNMFFIFVWIVFVFFIVYIFFLSCKTIKRKTFLQVIAFGIIISFLKFLIIFHLPQSKDTPSDAKRYMSDSRVILKYWQKSVTNKINNESLSKDGNLNTNSLNYHVSYSSLTNSHEWLYPVFLAAQRYIGNHWILFAVMSNLIIVGLMPVLTLELSNHLGASSRGALFGATFMVADFLTTINAVWLLRDSLAMYLICLILLNILNLIRGQSLVLVFLPFIISLLAATRVIAFYSLIFTMLFVFFGAHTNKLKLKITGVLIGSLICFSIIHDFPILSSNIFQISKNYIQPEVKMLTTDKDQVANADYQRDGAVEAWMTKFKNARLLNLIKSLIKTLFSPNPWNIFFNPLSWTFGGELYILASFIWFFQVPFILLGLISGLNKTRSLESLTLIIPIIFFTTLYIAYFGEWSTRQRAFMNPVFFAFASIGFDYIYHLMSSKKKENILSFVRGSMLIQKS